MRHFKKITPFLLALFDLTTMMGAIVLAYWSRELLLGPNDIPLRNYLAFFPFYIPLLLFLFDGLYHYRYDFWQECKVILRSLLFSLLLVFAYLAVTRSVENYSRYIVIAAFFFMGVLLPLQKRVAKYLLFHLGLWKKGAKLHGIDPFLERSIFDNYYLGFVKSDGAEAIFLNARNIDIAKLEKVIKREIKAHHELYFIPLLKDFNLAQSEIFEFFNSRKNLILLKNRIQNPGNLFVKNVIDKTVAVVVFLLCVPMMGVIALSLFLENPKAPILFRQQRVAKGGGRFWLLKFRTMYPDSDAILQEYLQSHPDKRREWRKYRKLKGYDPRVTRVGKILRRYSLDELPQLFNVLKGDMSLVGPRPYLAEEVERMGDAAHTIFLLKPGMTGLWQVSGRNSLTFSERIDIDIWYLYNWSLWNDFVILLKTVRALYEKSGY